MIATQQPWQDAARTLRRLHAGTTAADVEAAVDEGLTRYINRTIVGPTAKPTAPEPGEAKPGDKPQTGQQPPTQDQPTKPQGPEKERGVGVPAAPSGCTRGVFSGTVAERTHNGKGAWEKGKAKNAAKQRSEYKKQLSDWWLRRMVTTTRPATERVAWMWHGHFTSSISGVGHGPALMAQTEAFRSLGLGSFNSLAARMISDRAMLEWLDGQRSTKKAPNENLAREFMELFTMGQGSGYTEADVREGARALTGWIFLDSDAPVFIPERHDAGFKTILGQTGPWTSDDFVRIVLAQPSVTPHVATSIYRGLVSDQPPSDQTLARLVGALGKNRDLAAAVRSAVLPHEDTKGASRVIGPVEWAAGVCRMFKVDLNDKKKRDMVMGALRSMGQQPFHPPSVAGWGSGDRWLTMHAVKRRFDVAHALLKDANLNFVMQVPFQDRPAALARHMAIGQWSASTLLALQPLSTNPVMLCAAAVNTPEFLTV